MKRKLQRDERRVDGFVRAAFAASAGLVLLILLLAPTVSSRDGLASLMEAGKLGLALWRLSLFVLLIGGWPAFTAGYANWFGLTAEQTDCLKAYRWRMAVWLLVMEALFCHALWQEFARTLIEIGAWAA